MNSSNLGLLAASVSTATSTILLVLASSFSGPSEQVAGCVGWAFGLLFGCTVHENASGLRVKALALVFAIAVLVCVVVDEGFILLGGFIGWILGSMAGAGIASMKLCSNGNSVESDADLVVEPGRFAGLGMALVCDLFGMFSLVLKGRRRALTPDDFNPAAPTSFTLSYGAPNDVADQIDGAAAAARAEQAIKGGKKSRWPLLIQMALRERRALLLTGIVFGVVHGVINSVGRFLLLRASITAVVNSAPFEERAALAVGVVLVVVCEGILIVLAKHLFSSHFAHYVGGRMSSLVLRKVARLCVRPVGVEETQFVGADLPQVVELVRVVAFLPSGVVSLLCGLVVLLFYLGLAGAVGLVVLGGIFVINVKLAKTAKGADQKSQQRLKERLRVMKQVVEGVKAIKFYAWEENYAASVVRARIIEVAAIFKFKQLQISGVVLGRAGPIFGTVAVFVTRTAQGKPLSASQAFATLAVFQTLRVGMVFLPLAITLLGVLFSNLSRSEAYLNAPEVTPLPSLEVSEQDASDLLVRLEGVAAVWEASDDAATSHDNTEEVEMKAIALDLVAIRESRTETPLFDPLGFGMEEEEEDLSLEGEEQKEIDNLASPLGTLRSQQHVSSAAASVDHESGEATPKAMRNFMLRAPSLSVRSKEVVAIAGQVGSGKTMLLDTLLGGGPIVTQGELYMSQRLSIGLMPQEALVVSGTVSENITMGRPFDEERFKWAVQGASLSRDLTLLPYGAATVVGERGTTLSGGQQARLGVARALYGKPQLLVCDDPFAAVDALVGRDMFDALRAYVKNEKESPSEMDGATAHDDMSTTDMGKSPGALLVLNQLHLLPLCDKVLFMAGGKVVAQGSYQELLETCPAFQSYVASYQEQDTNSGSADDETEGSHDGVIDTNESLSAEVASNEGSKVCDEIQPEGDDKNKAKQLVVKEGLGVGGVKLAVVVKHLSKGGWWLWGLSVIMMVSSFVMLLANDLWLARWTSRVDAGEITGGDWYYCGIYCLLSTIHVVLNLAACLTFIAHGARASKNIHGDCLHNLLQAPLSWFESVPSGRILSRFSADLAIMDVQFSFYGDGFLHMTLSILMVLVLLSTTSLYLLALCIVSFFIFLKSGLTVFQSLRECKRIANSAISPVVSNVSEAVHGRLLGRVLGVSDFFVTRHMAACEQYLMASYNAASLVQFNSIATQLIALSISTVVILVVMLGPVSESGDSGVAGIALTYAFLLPYFFGLASDLMMAFFSLLPSLERLFEYLPGADLPSEAPRILPADAALQQKDGKRWPSAGALAFQDVEMRYRPGLPRALKGMSVHLQGGTKVGIVGRTGAGKSSLLVALFRLTEIEAGTISIDGQVLAEMGLKTLRESLAMIPQEAVLIEGTVRENLDPFNEHSTRALELALSKVGLSRSMLDQEVGTGGESLSVGERQLLAIGRVLLRASSSERGCKVCVMDEPTAHIDPATDAILQRVMREEFKGATLITIAHRLHTVADFDTILVMDQGRVQEQGTPLDLLAKPNGAFRSMVEALGPEAAASISAKARGAAAAIAAADSIPSLEKVPLSSKHSSSRFGSLDRAPEGQF